MLRTGLITGVGALVLAFSLVGCGEATVEDVQSRTTPIVTRVISEVQGSYSAARNMREVKQLLEGLTVVVPGLAGTSDSMKADWDSGLTDGKLAQQINEMLSTYLFTEGNVEGASADSVTFLLRGKVVCKAVEGDGGESANPECIKAVDQLQLRIVATLVDSDGVDLGFSIGSGPTVVTLRLRPDRVSVELSLAGASAAAQQIAELSGTTITLPDVMQGALSVSLVLNGPGDISLQSGIPQAVHVEGKTGNGNLRLKIAAREPVAELHLRRSPATVTLSVDWSSVDLLLPARDVWSQASGALQLVLEGLSAKLASDGKGGLSVSGVSLGQGTSTLSLDGKALVQVDLNPSSGRTLDLNLAPWIDDLPRCKVTPSLELQVKVALAPIEPYFDGALESWVRNEVYRLELTGAGGAEVGPLRESVSFAGGLKLLAGQLVLKSLVQPASVTVPTGSCLVWQDQPAPGGHPLLGRFASQVCP